MILFSCQLQFFFPFNSLIFLSNTNVHPRLFQVYRREELQAIADLCIKHNLLCFSDEVYEWLTYDGSEHVKIGERTARAQQDARKAVSHRAATMLCLCR